MFKTYGNLEASLRKTVENSGNIRWATDSDISMRQHYSRVLDIFLNKTDDKEIALRTMMRNSGYSDDLKLENGVEPPVSVWHTGNKDSRVCVCIYPEDLEQNDNSTYAHEAVHFLTNYGPKDKRLIKRDVPLTHIVGEFFRLMDEPKFRKNYEGSIGFSKGIPKRILNPMHFNYDDEHSFDTLRDSTFLAWTIYKIHIRYGGEKAKEFLRFISDNPDKEFVNFREGEVW